MAPEDYFIYIIQNNQRSDGCDYSVDDQIPICGKQVIVAIYKAEKPKFGGINIGPEVLSQLDIAVTLVKQQFGAAKYVGTAEEERLFDFAVKQSVMARPGLYLGCVNRGER